MHTKLTDVGVLPDANTGTATSAIRRIRACGPSSNECRAAPAVAIGRDYFFFAFLDFGAFKVSFTALAAVKDSFLEAAILIVAPVAGLRPVRAARL